MPLAASGAPQLCLRVQTLFAIQTGVVDIGDRETLDGREQKFISYFFYL
jgi:hypothetical protein